MKTPSPNPFCELALIFHAVVILAFMSSPFVIWFLVS